MARKVKDVQISLSDINIRFEPRTDAQARAMEVIKNHDITILVGPAGSSKTHTAVAAALKEMQSFNITRRKPIQKIFITRPIVEAGEELGALPGDMEEKCHPYLRPIYDIVAKLLPQSEKFIQENFEISPLAYMRGMTFENCVAVLDEANNATKSQLLLFMTRLGQGGKLIISGDTDQSDIGKASGLGPWVKALYDKPGIGFVEFTEEDIVRHPLVKLVLQNRPK